jgi:hypothetical protein
MNTDGYGWKLFAGILVILAGIFNVIDGLRAITSANQISGRFPNGNVQLPVTNNLKTWGWVILIIGAVMILAGFLIFSGNMFGRIVGVAVASVNAIVQLSYLDHNNFWSFTIILVDVLVIYGLVAHGGRVDEWRESDTRTIPVVPQTAAASGSTAEKLARLAELKANGTLTDAEFEQAKAQVLAEA